VIYAQSKRRDCKWSEELTLSTEESAKGAAEGMFSFVGRVSMRARSQLGRSRNEGKAQTEDRTLPFLFRGPKAGMVVKEKKERSWNQGTEMFGLVLGQLMKGHQRTRKGRARASHGGIGGD